MFGMRLVLAIALTFATLQSASADKKKDTIEIQSPSFGNPPLGSGSGTGSSSKSKGITPPKQNVGTSGARHK